MDFDTLLLLIAKIGFSLVALMILLRFAFVPYLWFKYDRPIQKVINDADAAKKKLHQDAAGRGITTGGIAPHITAIERPAQEKLEILKLKRQHFLDRINLFVSMASVGKS